MDRYRLGTKMAVQDLFHDDRPMARAGQDAIRENLVLRFQEGFRRRRAERIRQTSVQGQLYRRLHGKALPPNSINWG